jgi:trigger factor
LQTTFNNITDTEQELIITYSKNEIQPILDSAYSDVAKKIRLDGFRAGKAPLHLIKKMYGSSIESEEFAKLADKVIPEVLKENNLFIVSQPNLRNMEKKEGGLELIVHYHYIPDFELKDYKSLVIDEPVHRVTDEEINEYLDNISYNSKVFEETEIVTDKNFKVHLELVSDNALDLKPEVDNSELDKSETSESIDNSVESEITEIVDELNNPEFPIILRDRRYSPKFIELLMDKKVGDLIHYTPEHHHHEGEEEHTHEHKTVTHKIKKIEKIIPNELTEEFILEISNEKFKTVDELKEDLGFQLQNEWDTRSKNILENSIIENILKMHEVKIPDFTILEQAKKMFDDDKKNNKTGTDNFEDEAVKSYYLELGEKVIKWEMIRDKIIETEDLKVEDFDIDEFIDRYKFYETLDRDLVKQTIFENKQIINSIMVKKVMNFLIDFTTTNEVEFTQDDLAMASFDEELDDDFEDDEIFDADEEFIDEEEFDDEFFADEDEFDEFEEDEDDLEDDDDEDEEEEDDDDDEFEDDDEDASKK